jgi:hypothetical protein
VISAHERLLGGPINTLKLARVGRGRRANARTPDRSELCAMLTSEKAMHMLETKREDGFLDSACLTL